MTLCQFIVMITADSYEELEQNTESLMIIARKNQVTLAIAEYKQEQALSSVLPLGNSNTADKNRTLQVQRTLSSESTAVFCPFNAMEIVHEGGLYYGVNQQSRSIILFDRRKLSNPNGLYCKGRFYVPGKTDRVKFTFHVINTDFTEGLRLEKGENRRKSTFNQMLPLQRILALCGVNVC